MIAQPSRVLGCILCRLPRMSDGLLLSDPAHLETDKPVCASCTDATGWQWAEREGGAK